MSAIKKITRQVQEAEQAAKDNARHVCTEHLRMARQILADGVIGGDIDAGDEEHKMRLQQLLVRAGTNCRNTPNDTAGNIALYIAWGHIVSAIGELLETGGVPMADGRVATANGWNYENCPPFHLVLNEETNDRLVARARQILPNADEQAINSLLDKILREWLKDAPR
jgi:hypothetical protein